MLLRVANDRRGNLFRTEESLRKSSGALLLQAFWMHALYCQCIHTDWPVSLGLLLAAAIVVLEAAARPSHHALVSVLTRLRLDSVD